MLKIIITRWVFVLVFIVLSVPAIFATFNGVSDQVQKAYNYGINSNSQIVSSITLKFGNLTSQILDNTGKSTIFNTYKDEYEKAGIPIPQALDTVRQYADHELAGQPTAPAGYYKDKLDQTLKSVEK